MQEAGFCLVVLQQQYVLSYSLVNLKHVFFITVTQFTQYKFQQNGTNLRNT